MDPKARAASAAVDLIESGMTVGLGTGSTAEHFLQQLGAAIADGRLRGIHGVATSLQSERRARQLHIPLISLDECAAIDITVDGADEIDPSLNLIKGLGGALLREKIVAQNSRRLIIIADASKRVVRLGTRSPLPVEVAVFGHEVHEPFLRSLGCDPVLRRVAGNIFVTDNGNVVYDCRFAAGIDRPDALADALRGRAGIVEHGLFLDLAETALIADAHAVQPQRR